MFRTTLLLITLALALSIACGDHDDGAPAPSASASFPEGEMRIEIELLDTGLLKGHAYGDAAEGWVIPAFHVEATDPGGTQWRVIEPQTSGIGGASVTDFFEVVIQELPRGDQLMIEAIATFQADDGSVVERRVVDNWPH